MAEENCRKGNHRNRIIEAEKKRYSSITAFCDFYGFRYTSVMYYLRKGKTGDEIISIMRQKPAASRYKKAPGRGIPVKIGEDTFQSISEAAMVYGVTPAQIEAAMIDGDATPVFLNMDSLDESDRLSERMKPCVIAGVRFPSRAAAAREYGIPMVTIRSRMQRDKISFEEAIRRGHIERRQIIAEMTKWEEQIFSPYDGEIDTLRLTKEIVFLLEKNCYRPQILCNQEELFAIHIQESLEVISPPLDLYVICNEKDASQDVEFIIPNLGKLRILSDAKQTLLYQQISEVNGKYTGAKIFLQEGFFSASWSFAQTSRTLQSTFFMRTLYRFVGSTSAMWDALKWAEKESIQG